MSVLEHMCPKCDYYLPLVLADSVEVDEAGAEVTVTKAIRSCRNCGHQQDEKAGLVMETVIDDEDTEAYLVYINENTKDYPGYPHTDTLQCPNQSCPSRHAQAKPDVVIIRYDTKNLKYVYLCAVCDTHWRNRSS
jgi:hypothetical protein